MTASRLHADGNMGILHSRDRLFLAARAIALFSTSAAYGQTAAGEINGFVTDKTGGAVAAATVKLTNQGTQVVDRTQTNASGHFLPMGQK